MRPNALKIRPLNGELTNISDACRAKGPEFTPNDKNNAFFDALVSRLERC